MKCQNCNKTILTGVLQEPIRLDCVCKCNVSNGGFSEAKLYELQSQLTTVTAQCDRLLHLVRKSIGYDIGDIWDEYRCFTEFKNALKEIEIAMTKEI
jgi:hypothetical protein